MQTLKDRFAVITGASSGIGRAIALGLAAQGVKLCLVGRKLETLKEVAVIAQKTTSTVVCYLVDLTVDEDIINLTANLKQDCGQVDLLVLSAGSYSMGTLQNSSIQDLDFLYRANVRAPYLLTQSLLPMLLSSQGQIVFINSSAIMRTRANVGQFAATQHSLKAIADSLREEVNPHQVRVLSVYPGRTATPRQAMIHEMEGKPYHPERFMQPEDVASVVINALSLPRSAEVTDIHLRPFAKPM
ncbi:MAG: SDR family NAD(P)-dependent oxidoreductase [Scytonema sp. PMC 1069.18]|nr:SDR family NAD(P)-dependent oxidoreductase [Scytonema sp. PMC 1069.18]MEC4880869.1 SDR family NAD(P)-dependent oxidoreductase [Scytonema sp. PMC 1070.18]